MRVREAVTTILCPSPPAPIPSPPSPAAAAEVASGREELELSEGLRIDEGVTQPRPSPLPPLPCCHSRGCIRAGGAGAL